LRGDMARSRGDLGRARQYYLEAQAAGHDTEFLRLKLDEISA
jgi:predicted negative regulator of RcsB-dependent stress response